MARYRAVAELILAGLALVGVGASWLNARHIVAVGPITDGQPSTTSLVYNPQLLLLAMLLAMIAGVLAVVGIARLWRIRAALRRLPEQR
jgi:hypothetical protein